MTQQHHIIKQQILELHVCSGTNAFEMQNQISILYRSQIVPLIETICNQLSDLDTIHRIDRIEIDLGEIEAESLETDFAQKATAALWMQMSQILAATPVQSTRSIPSPSSDPTLAPAIPNGSSLLHDQAKSASPTSPTQARFELFREFIQTGCLPWWSKPLDRNGLEECFSRLLADSPDKLKNLCQEKLKQKKIIQRILYQFSEPVRIELLKLLAPALQPIFCSYLEDLQRLICHIESFQKFSSQHLSQVIWQGLFLHLFLPQFFSPPITKPEIDAILRANLLHIATDLNLDGRSLIQQLLTTIETLTLAGTYFNSELPHILTTFPLANDTHANNSRIPLRNRDDRDTSINTVLSDQISASHPLRSTDSQFGDEQGTSIEPPLTVQRSLSRPLGSTSTSARETEDIYIQNAGIILLWPFLNRFFEILGLVELGQFRNLQATRRAILLLQYLVDASLDSLEASLPLNKLLCGLDLSEPIPTDLMMTEKEQSESEIVLSAVIANWSTLGNISITGLRRAFLQRAGILRSHREGWLLQVEQQTYDVLLDRLPWSIRVIQLPWMVQILHTEW